MRKGPTVLPSTIGESNGIAERGASGSSARSFTAGVPRAVYAIAVLAILVRLIVAGSTHFTSEDYLITLRYAQNLAHGHGLVYNPGERVLGTTTPLYTLFLAFWERIGLPATLAGKAINILADGGLCVLAYRFLCGIGEERAGIVAAFWIAVCPLQIQWSISGMETSLVTCCVMWTWTAFQERRSIEAYVAAALLVLLRWDGILLFAVLTAAFCGRERRFPVREVLLFTLILLPWLLTAVWYYGNPIPVTAMAKSTVYGWRANHAATWLLRTLPGLPKLAQRFLFNPGYGLLSLLASFGALRAWQRRHTALLPPLLWVGLYWTAFLVSRVLLFPWYLIPPLPIYEAFMAMGLVSVVEWAQLRSLRLPPLPVTAGLMAMLTIGCAVGAGVMARGEQGVEERVRIPLALWIKAHSGAGDYVMLEPIGYIGFYSERPVLDVVGLVTPRVLPFYKPQNEAPMLEIARAFRPEWCVLRPGEIDRIRRVANAEGKPWEESYALVQTFYDTPGSNVYLIYKRR